MFVPKPKNAFQSPGAQMASFVLFITFYFNRSNIHVAERGENPSRIRNPAEDSTLRLDHLQTHFLKFLEVRSHAISQYKAIKTAVVGLADRSVDADLGGDAGDYKFLNTAVLQDRVEIGGEKRALTRFVDY